MREKEASSTGVQIVRPLSRRKFVVGLLGGGAILAAGTPGLQQLAQSIRVGWNTKPYPYNIFNGNDDLIGDSYSPDLNFMAMIKVSDDGSDDAQLYIWDYQQQRMITLPPGSASGTYSWGPDNRSLLVPSQASLDLWDVQTGQHLASYDSENSQGFAGPGTWSPDGSRVAMFASNDGNNTQNVLVIMSVHPLKLLDTFRVPDSTTSFIWSPDGRTFAFLQSTSVSTNWNILIWDRQNHLVEATLPFQGSSPDGLAWSPDGKRIALYSGDHIHIIEVGNTPTTYTLNSNGKFAWSPDGKRIALFSRDHIQIVEMGNTPTIHALNEPHQNGNFVWSPDSRHLAVAVEIPSSEAFEFTGKFGVWDVIERKFVRLLRYSTFFEIPDALYWTPDGTTIRAIADVYRQENWSWP